MTDTQKKRLYFPAWRDCCRANDWRWAGGRPVQTARRSHPLHGEFARLWSVAERLARQAHRAVALDDLRHGVHILALGFDKSSQHLSNGEVNRVVDLMHFLRDPENLDHVARWQDAEISPRRSMLSFLEKKAPSEYIARIASDKFATPHWRDLDLAQLRSLAAIIAKRAGKFREPVGRADEKTGPPLTHSPALPLTSSHTVTEEPF